ncbi:MAG: hypothetical protein PHW95_00955 [Patescibacteria group bacterium]|nr:hypothetical protein [Patescibacteria group bacterium]
MIINSPNQGRIFAFLSDKIIRLSFLFAVLANIALWLLLVSRSTTFSDSIPLHYNIYFGIDLIGPWYQFFFMPSIGLGIIVSNFLIGLLTVKYEKILGHFLAVTAAAAQIFILAAIIAILIINF